MAVVIGTRPEAIKLAPVALALQGSKRLRPVLIGTSQHGDLVEPILANFGLRLNYDLRVMRPGQSLWDLAGVLIERLGNFWRRHKAAVALVQGDTASALMGALSAFYHGIPVGHVEAGLRTGLARLPFPEEMHRRLLASLATWHFAPTAQAVRQLRSQGIPNSTIHQTGNTVVDALRWMNRRPRNTDLDGVLGPYTARTRMLLVTCHRRENWGEPLRAVARSLKRLAQEYPDLLVVFPLHPNPVVRRSVLPLLEGLSNVKLLEPLDYPQFLSCLRRAWLVWSDSGGVQEEATVLGKPVLVLREATERPEGVQSGPLRLVGTDEDRILGESRALLNDETAYRKLARSSQVFGDGLAARRIVAILERALAR